MTNMPKGYRSEVLRLVAGVVMLVALAAVFCGLLWCAITMPVPVPLRVVLVGIVVFSAAMLSAWLAGD